MRTPRLLPALLALLALASLASSPREARAGEDTTGANAGVPARPASFRYGINYGYTPGWTNPQKTQIAAAAGATTARLSLPASFLAKWGVGIVNDNGDMASYDAAGYRDLTAFLGSPTPENSTAPAGGDTTRYSPAGLYEPIWQSPGVVNPMNPWAAYVAAVVATYKDHVRVWEIWNEPDFTSNFAATQKDWFTQPPAPGDLSNWHDSVFAYIRMLRISYEVAKSIDPNAIIALGGIGYEGFLDAVLRYTDDPAAGALGPDFPARGGAWFDAVSFHHYPQFGAYDRKTQAWQTSTDSDALADGLAIARSNFTLQLEAHGYGSKFPQKLWLCTETGLASRPFDKTASGPDPVRAYLLKGALVAMASDLFQLHWFDLNDAEPDAQGTDPFGHMGLYLDLTGQSPATAARKPPAVAYGTATAMLTGTTYDAASTAALTQALSPGARAFVLRLPDGRKRTALWARTSMNSESASLTAAVPAQGNLDLQRWDFAKTGAVEPLSPSGGTASLPLDAMPVFLTETSASDPAGAGGAGGGAGAGPTASGGASGGGAAGGAASGGGRLAPGGAAEGPASPGAPGADSGSSGGCALAGFAPGADRAPLAALLAAIAAVASWRRARRGAA